MSNSYARKYTNRLIGYSNEFRQVMSNEVETLMESRVMSAVDAWQYVAKRLGVHWNTVRRAHNALGNAARIRSRFKGTPNVQPILRGYSEEFRHEAMLKAMRIGVISSAKEMGCDTHSIYDWLKAYGYSSAYFNRA